VSTEECSSFEVGVDFPKRGEGVELHEPETPFDGNFNEVYEDNNKSAGVYERPDTDSDWSYKGS